MTAIDPTSLGHRAEEACTQAERSAQQCASAAEIALAAAPVLAALQRIETSVDARLARIEAKQNDACACTIM